MKNALCRIALFFIAAPTAAFAGPPLQLHFPIDCKAGQACWIVNYVDTDPGPGIRDYTCGSRSYDGHDGVDIGLPDRVAMETGIRVLAAGNGTVVRIRDKMEDHEPDAKELADLLKDGHGCGNGVLLDHGQGWQTLYCHMKKNSVTARPGRPVQIGDMLGLAGQSGAAEFPHLHLSVLHEGKIVDPFTGRNAGAGCDEGTKKSLWAADAAPPYEPVVLYAAGFHGGIPDFEAIKIDSSSPRAVDPHAKALTFWTAFYGVQAGDRIHMTITAPDGNPFAEHDIVQEKDKARQFYYIGRPSKAGLKPGIYKGIANLARTGKPPVSRSIERTVAVP